MGTSTDRRVVFPPDPIFFIPRLENELCKCINFLFLFSLIVAAKNSEL